MKVNFKNILLLLLVVAAVIAAVSFFNEANADKTDFTYGNLVQLFEENAVKSCVIDGKSVVVVKAYEVQTDKEGMLLKNADGTFIYVKDANNYYVDKEYSFQLNYMFQVEHIHQLATESESIENYNYLEVEETPWYMTYLPFINLGLLFIILWIFVMKSAGSAAGGKMGSFSKSRA